MGNMAVQRLWGEVVDWALGHALGGGTMADTAVSDFPVERLGAQRRRDTNDLRAAAAASRRARAKAEFSQYRVHLRAKVAPLLFGSAIAVVLWVGWLNRDDNGLTPQSGVGYWLGNRGRQPYAAPAAVSVAKTDQGVASDRHRWLLVPGSHDSWRTRAGAGAFTRKFPARFHQQQCCPRCHACCCSQRRRGTVSLQQDFTSGCMAARRSCGKSWPMRTR